MLIKGKRRLLFTIRTYYESTKCCLCELTTGSLEVYVFSDQAAYWRTREETPFPHKYLLYEITRLELG